MAVVYHWKHGWIPLDHEAALSKAKGNHTLATKMLADAHSSRGITSRQDVAKAVRDLPNVPSNERGSALTQLQLAAEHHNSTDLLPARNHGNMTRSSNDSEHQFQMANTRSRSAVTRPADHNFATLSNEHLNAAIERARKANAKSVLNNLLAEKARRNMRAV